ncbi:MAG TPA: hypothetical protein VMJ10_27310 [Kofleriaceae bacterium]|nr:hypothetical protein [Kofleriaceae bacterium]
MASAATELASLCDREAPEYGPVWHGIAKNAAAAKDSLLRDELQDLLQGGVSMFAYRPGSFSEVYVQRSDYDEQIAENNKFDALKDRVADALAALRSAMAIA